MFIEQLFNTQRPSLAQLKDFLQTSKEDSRIEFKRDVLEDVDKNLLREVVAFTNSEGGVLFIGVTDAKREIVGTGGSSEQYENFLLSRIEPSIAGLFVIETVDLSPGKNVFIIEVERSPQIHAVKLHESNKKGHRDGFAYYYRSAMSTQMMTPSIINRISAIKKDLTYNFNFRVSIFLSVNDLLKNLLAEIKFSGKHNLSEDELVSLSKEYLRHFDDSKKALNVDIVSIMRSMRLEFLYKGLWEAITFLYSKILETERDTPHTALTFEEDINLRMLKRILNEGLGIEQDKANFDYVNSLIYIKLNHEVFYHYNLGLLSARTLVAYMLDYLSPQGYRNEEAHMKLVLFDRFIHERNDFGWPYLGDSGWLTIDDLKKLMGEYLKKYPPKENYGVFEKIERRKNEFFYYFTENFANMILKLIELRDYLYYNLSLPISKYATETEYNKYLKSSKLKLIYPAHRGLYEP
ncbi:MAG: AlbA family DNA-binding domain-containing protein [Thermoplasmataceae archaeon]